MPIRSPLTVLLTERRRSSSLSVSHPPHCPRNPHLNPPQKVTSRMGHGALDPSKPPGLDLVSAFLAMESTASLLNMSKLCGGGRVTEEVQMFIWDHCISQSGSEGGRTVFVTNFLKKIISEVESSGGVVLDELYEQCGYFMASSAKILPGSSDPLKCYSGIQGCWKLSSCPSSGRLVIPLNCSLNMLEGDTGCSVWPSSFYLSEFILSFPDLFYNQSCFEVGSGVGLVGICLAHVKASKVILTDGDLSTLANLKLNLELNRLSKTKDIQYKDELDNTVSRGFAKGETDIKSQLIPVHLPWESASESELQKFVSDIILGADVIYNPSCLPDLVRVLAILLSPRHQHSHSWKHSSCSSVMANADGVKGDSHDNSAHMDPVEEQPAHALNGGHGKGPVAYIASVIRNVDTFECFLELSKQAGLLITDVTETSRPFKFLPYMQTYDRNSIRLFRVISK